VVQNEEEQHYNQHGDERHKRNDNAIADLLEHGLPLKMRPKFWDAL
jgi:hypothetical protein